MARRPLILGERKANFGTENERQSIKQAYQNLETNVAPRLRNRLLPPQLLFDQLNWVIRGWNCVCGIKSRMVLRYEICESGFGSGAVKVARSVIVLFVT